MMREPAYSLLRKPSATSLKGKRVLVLGLGDTGLSVANWVARQGGVVRAADTRAHRVVNDLESGIAACDVIMMLRIQKERMETAQIPDADRYFQQFGLSAARLAQAKPGAIVMHPQPMNRGIEIASEVADGPQSVIRDQVRNGVAVRMAVLEAVVEGRGQ